MIAGKGEAKVRLASPEEMANDTEACKRQSLRILEVLSQARLPIPEGGFSLTSIAYIREATYV